MRNVPVIRCAGYTLTELVIVVTILAITAAIAIPSTTSNEDEQLELAAQNFAAAMRFARSESIRTGKPHGFRQGDTKKRIRVFSMDDSTSPPQLIYDIHHPVDKQIYDIELDLQSLAAADSVIRNVAFRGTCTLPANAYFDAEGTPWCTDPETVLLERFEVQLYLGNDRRMVSLEGLTGRVTVQ